MKIRSVLLGSVAIAGLTTAGYAADLGVVTSLDVCDNLGISGLTISSNDNCLAISGNISFEYDVGDYAPGASIYGPGFARHAIVADHDPVAVGAQTGVPVTITIPKNDGVLDSKVDLDWWLKFVATANSDFGPATATIKLLNNNWGSSASGTVLINEAWVGVGDTTMLMAGYKSSIFNTGDDKPLNYLGLFNSSDVNTGVGFRAGAKDGGYPLSTVATVSAGQTAFAGVKTGGMSIQVVSNLGNGLSIGGGFEGLGTSAVSPTVTTPAAWTAVGTLNYAGDGITAHASGAIDQANHWIYHAGFTGAWDKFKAVAAVAADYTGWWNALASASATFDMFTLAGSVEATSGGEWGVGGSASATVSDGVSLNFGGRYFTNGGANVTQLEAGVSAAVTEAITLSAAVGGYSGTGPTTTDFYGKGGVSWAPGGGFTASATGEVHSDGGYKAVFKASKSIK